MKSKRLSLSCFAAVLKKRLLPIVITALALAIAGFTVVALLPHQYAAEAVFYVRDLQADAYFAENGITTMKLLQNNTYLTEGVAIGGTRGWYNDAANAPEESDYRKIVAREVQRLTLSLDSVKDETLEKIVFMHFPPVFEHYVCRPLVELLKQYGVKRCYFGHIHGVYQVAPIRHFEGIDFHLVSADFLNFTPLLIEKAQKS